MHLVKYLESALVFLFLGSVFVQQAQAQESAGWQRAPLTSALSEILGEEFTTTEIDLLPQNLFLLDPDEELSCFNFGSPTIEAGRFGEVSSLLLIGDESVVHTLWFYFPILNARDAEASFAFYEKFFMHLFPDWDGAGTWAEQSAEKSWGASAKAYQDPTISYNDMIARERVDGTLLATAGVPPDILTYRITTRTDCEHVSEYLLASPRRSERNPAARILDQAVAGLQMNSINPAPIDISTVPVFLGEVSGSSENNSSNTQLRFSSRGPMPGARVELDSWLFEQDGFSGSEDEWSEIKAGWGYESNFHWLVTQPELDISDENESRLLLVEKATGRIQRTSEDDFDLQWANFGGLLFSNRINEWVDNRDPEPPYLIVPEGDLVFLNEGSAVPVDVSSTPIHLGRVRQYLRATEVETPFGYTAEVSGGHLAIVANETSSTLNLVLWAGQQTGGPLAPDRARPISRPEIQFELNGQRHQLVVSSAWFSEEDGVPSELLGLSGQVFREL